MRVAVIGTGIMGAPMVERLIDANHSVRIYNRTRSKTDPLVAIGAEVANTPGEAASQAQLVISMLTDPTAVAEATLGPQGILSSIDATAVHADMSTVTPQSAAKIAKAYSDAEKRFVQAPVLGNKRHIADGKLLIFAGGSENDIDVCEAAWTAFSNSIRRFPDAAQASTAKLASNMLIGQMILALGQTLVYARCGGLDPQTMLDIVMSSNLAAPMYSNKGKTIIADDYTPNFYARHMLKDLTLAAQSASDAGIPQPMNDAACAQFEAAVAQGYGDSDYSAVVKVLEDLAGMSIVER